MKKRKFKKILLSSVILLQVSGYVPWSVIPAFAEGTTTSSEGTNKPLEAGDKLTTADLPEATQKKLDEITNEEQAAANQTVALPEGSQETISEKILADFKTEEVDTLKQLTKEAVTTGKEEVVKERTELSKTFVDATTGLGETILFSSPIHVKDEKGVWQELKTTIKENQTNMIFMVIYILVNSGNWQII